MAKQPSDQPEIIYSMMRVSKFYNSKPVIKDISLSYFYGAKIGVLGLNGSGKSTVLRIMAGVDQDFNGEAVLSKGYTTGLLEQEPKLDEAKTVREVVEEGAAAKVALLTEYNEISEKFADPDADMDALLARQGDTAGPDRHLDCWDLDSQLEQAMDALRCPDPDTPVDGPLRRRTPPRGPVPAAAPEARHPAAGRAHQPPGRRDRGLAGAPPAAATRAPSSPSPTTATSWTTWPAGSWSWTGARASPGRATTPAGWSRSRRAWPRRRRPTSRAAEDPGARAGMDPHVAQGPARQEQGAHLQLREPARPGERAAREGPGDLHPRRAAPGRRGGRSWRASAKAYGDKVLFEDLDFAIPRGGILGVIGANGAGKTTLFRMLAGQERPDAGSVRIGETVKMAMVDQLRQGLDPGARASARPSPAAAT